MKSRCQKISTSNYILKLNLTKLIYFPLLLIFFTAQVSKKGNILTQQLNYSMYPNA